MANKDPIRDSLSHVRSYQTPTSINLKYTSLRPRQLRSMYTSAAVNDEPKAMFPKDTRRVPCDLLNFMESSPDQFLQLQDPEYLWDTNCVSVGKDGLIDPDSKDPLHGFIIPKSVPLSMYTKCFHRS